MVTPLECELSSSSFLKLPKGIATPAGTVPGNCLLSCATLAALGPTVTPDAVASKSLVEIESICARSSLASSI